MADGTLKPNEALLPGVGLVQAKSFAVPFPAPVAPKEPVVTIPKTEPVHLPTSPATSPQPVPPVLPTSSAPTPPTSSFLDQELGKLRQEVLQGIAAPSVPSTAPSSQPAPSSMPRPTVPPAPALAAPRELLWSQLGVGYVGMQPFARPMVNGGLSGAMTGFGPISGTIPIVPIVPLIPTFRHPSSRKKEHRLIIMQFPPPAPAERLHDFPVEILDDEDCYPVDVVFTAIVVQYWDLDWNLMAPASTPDGSATVAQSPKNNVGHALLLPTKDVPRGAAWMTVQCVVQMTDNCGRYWEEVETWVVSLFV